ncbi:response regulator [Sessilibacter corallicola]|uniref:response regulator n=1 Tax=Sessilibacter corallicola TaxID=2904075 RepID=UPI001E2F3A59|nr:response regulator [Sessilibacter corallicola]MCE2028962.1 response regulator [Sessilibacter corallicola]
MKAFSAKGKRVLVVDDFEGFRLAIARKLEEQGNIRADTTHSGEEALKLCRNRYYDAILTDFNLGAGKTGLQVLEALRFHNELEPKQVFMLISAENNKQIVLAATDVEPDAYIAKPITTHNLGSRLARIFKQRKELNKLYEYLGKDNTGAAIDACRQHIEHHGYYAPFCEKVLGELLIQLGDLPTAKSHYESILLQRPLDWARLGLANVLVELREYDDAEENLKSIINENPFVMKAYDQLHQVYDSKQDLYCKQEIMEKAVAVSPLSFARQKCLAETALGNKNYLVAAGAYKKIMRLGRNSVYHQPEQIVDYARTAAVLTTEDPEAGLAFCKDAQVWFGQKNKNANSSDSLQNQMVSVQLLSGLGEHAKALNIFSDVELNVSKIGEDLPFECEVDYVFTLKSIEKLESAEKYLISLCSKYQDEEKKLEILDQLLAEPVSHKNKAIVAAMNRRGIAQYEQKNYSDAATLFLRARKLFPKHLGINLNLVQVLYEEMKSHGMRSDYMLEVEASLNAVRAVIQVGDQQYQRFACLEAEFKDMKSKM